MASFTHHAASRNHDLDARTARIRGKILDGIEQTLDELAQPDLQRAAIENAAWARVAPLFCRQARCRRARRCRRNPCVAPHAAAKGDHD